MHDIIIANLLVCTSSSDAKPLAFSPQLLSLCISSQQDPLEKGDVTFHLYFSLFFFNGLCTSVGIKECWHLLSRSRERSVWVEQDECSRLHRVSGGSAPQEHDGPQKTIGNSA